MGFIVDKIKGLVGIERAKYETVRTGQDTITSTLSRIGDFSNFDIGIPAHTEYLRFQVVSGGPINVNSPQVPTAGGTEGSPQFLTGDFFEVDGPDMVRVQFILATGGANADVRVNALRRLR